MSHTERSISTIQSVDGAGELISPLLLLLLLSCIYPHLHTLSFGLPMSIPCPQGFARNAGGGGDKRAVLFPFLSVVHVLRSTSSD